jgi:NAD(P)-dependent dehydrogenase (short-subunit alcohol dehydrogenase family)
MTPLDTNRVALVTGAARRIGRAIALDLAGCGYDIAVHYRNSLTDAEALASAIRANGRRAAVVHADLGDIGSVLGLIPAVSAALGPPVCLINNASEFENDTAADMTPASWVRHLDTNLKAPVFLAQALAAQLPAGAEGNVINIIDQRVWKPTPEFFSYSVSKAGLWSATRMLAQALAPRIRVNGVGPGPVLQSVHQSEDEFADEQASTLLKRGATPEEIAAAVRFILQTPSMTGQMIALDGGQHLTWR